MFNALIVEDNKNIRKLIDTVLTKEGFNTHLASDGVIALDILEKVNIDFIILDIMMPNMDGFTFAKLLRDNNYDIPIIMITAKDTIEDKREGFNIGVDDYITKPFDSEELVLRVNAILRRANINHEKIIKIKDVTLDYNTLTVSKGDLSTTLPQKEFQLLFKLLSFPNTIFTKQQLFNDIWGIDSDSMDHTITVHINRLRKRFKDYDDFEIMTLRNIGYKAVIHE